MTLGILKEPVGENRVALLPEGAASFVKLKVNVLVETDAGLNARARNGAYEDVGAVLKDRNTVIQASDVLVMIQPPSDADLDLMKEGQVVLGMYNPLIDTALVKKMVARGITVFSLDTIPRITRAQSMDVLSSMATVAGYKAVIDAAHNLPYFFPMLMTAAGTIKPARVLILGAGVAGLQAIATSRKLGAIVHAFDVRSAVKEQVLSLGAKFVEVEGATEDAAAGGYAVEQTEEFKQKQAQAIHDRAVESDVVIATAQIPGRRAPVLLRKETVEMMHPASVIIDLAASSGGNCELTRDNEVVVHNQVRIIGKSNYPSDMPSDASKMYGNNVINFMKLMLDNEGGFSLNFEDEIVKGTCVAHQREVINERVKAALAS
jgi:NAD(P) transhydrogenase subunit alpha